MNLTAPEDALYPKFRPGVTYFRNSSEEIYIGFKHRGLVLKTKSPTVDRTLESFDGSTSIAEIAMKIANEPIDPQLIRNFLTPLVAYNFVELATTRIRSANSRELLSQSVINQAARVLPEVNLYSWQFISANQVEISAAEQIANRANFSVLVFGKNRLATTLFTLLQASGFNRTKLISRSHGLLQRSQNGPKRARKITVDQICGLGIRSSDLGMDFDSVISEISQGAQLSFLDRPSFPTVPSFIISTERAQADYVQRWMSEGVPYLLISDLVESQMEIGPIVIPGVTPCAFCLELWRSENNPIIQKLDLLNSITDPLEIPASAVAAIAGIVVLQTSQFAATGKSRLIGSSVRINLLEPCYPESVHYQPHSGCGCIV